MNKERRKAIDTIREKLEELNCELEGLQSEERDAFDAMPEGLQGGERGQASEAAADALDEAASSLYDVISSLETAAE